LLDHILAALALSAMVWLVADTVRLGAPPMPSDIGAREAVVKLIEALQGHSDRPLRVVEAGAGWGGLAALVARRLPNSRVLAVEGAGLPALWCAMLSRLGGRFSSRWGDATRCPLDAPDVVVAFLGPEGTQALAERLARDFPEARLVSVGFAVRGWERVLRVGLSDHWHTEVAVWRLPSPPSPGPPCGPSIEKSSPPA